MLQIQKKKTDREVLLHVHVQLHVLALILYQITAANNFFYSRTGLEKNWIQDIPLGTQTSQFACPGPLPAAVPISTYKFS